MSNNKQSMKLYTEEQVIQMIESSYLHGFERAHDYKDVKEHILKSVNPIKLQSVTTIELPSDVEIEAHVEDDFLNASEVHKYSEEAQLLMKAMCKAGALWMRNKIQGGNNEQQ